jgi:hypothetical protein
MLIDVEDPLRNIILNFSLILLVLMTIAAIIPWGTLGAERIGRLATLLPIPVLAVALVYETAMPSRYDIRLDLFLLLPAYGLVLLATLIRLLVRWKVHRKREAEQSVSRLVDITKQSSWRTTHDNDRA